MKKIYDKRKIRKALDIDIYPRGGGKIDLRVLADTADSVSLGSDVQSEPVSNDSTIFGDSDAYVKILDGPPMPNESPKFKYVNVADYFDFVDGVPIEVKSEYTNGQQIEGSYNVDIYYKSDNDLNNSMKINTIAMTRANPIVYFSRTWGLNDNGYYRAMTGSF